MRQKLAQLLLKLSNYIEPKSEKEIEIAYKSLFLDLTAGDIVLKDLAQVSEVLGSHYTNDPYTLAFMEGKRELFRYILTRISSNINQNIQGIN